MTTKPRRKHLEPETIEEAAERQWKIVDTALSTRWILHGDERVKAERDEWRSNKSDIVAHMAKMLRMASPEKVVAG